MIENMRLIAEWVALICVCIAGMGCVMVVLGVVFLVIENLEEFLRGKDE